MDCRIPRSFYLGSLSHDNFMVVVVVYDDDDDAVRCSKKSSPALFFST
jgi:hypothetical protein